MSDEAHLRLAIAKARDGMRFGQVPVAAVIARGDAVVGVAHNTVWRDLDPTGHAEMNAIRVTAFALRTIFLNGCTAYCTLEPCPMCMGALMWSKVDRIVYGASIADAAALNFPEIILPAERLAAMAGSPVRIEQYAPLREECVSLFREWYAAGAPRKTRLPGT